MMNKTLALVCALMMLPAVHAAEVYKWKDAEGRTRYTDIPPRSNIPYRTLSGKKSPEPAAPVTEVAPVAEGLSPAENPSQPASDAAVSAAPKAAPAKTPADKDIEAAKKKLEAEKAKKQQEEKLAEQKARDQNCTTARNALSQMEQGGRIYSGDGKGGRVYLSDDEIEQKKVDARKKVEEWCGAE